MKRTVLLSLWQGLIGDRTSAQVVRFLLTGILNTAFSYCVFTALVLGGVGLLAALVAATIAGVLFNFQTIGRLVFGHIEHRLILRFVGVYLAVFTLNWAGLSALVALGVSALLAQALLTPLFAALSFLGHKFLVFDAQPRES